MPNRNAFASVSTVAFILSYALLTTGCSKEDSTPSAAATSEEAVQVAAVSEPASTAPPPPRNAPTPGPAASDPPEGWSSGPEIGTKIPEFSGVDQNGKTRTFADIAGPEGAYIVFQRSADW